MELLEMAAVEAASKDSNTASRFPVSIEQDLLSTVGSELSNTAEDMSGVITVSKSILLNSYTGG